MLTTRIVLLKLREMRAAEVMLRMAAGYDPAIIGYPQPLPPPKTRSQNRVGKKRRRRATKKAPMPIQEVVLGLDQTSIPASEEPTPSPPSETVLPTFSTPSRMPQQL